jgi:two-component system osmolarity sensor histidine kinase EnvZ
MNSPLPRSVFGQLVLVIALVLIGAGVLAILLGRELATRPAAEQLLRAMQGFAAVVEALDRHQPHARTVQQLRDAGLQVHPAPPADERLRFAPMLRELREQADDTLGTGRELRIQARGDSRVIWLKPATRRPLWVAFAQDRPRTGMRYFSVLMLMGSVALVWLAAAYFARRLVLPLRQLAAAAPAIVRGDAPPVVAARAPREVAGLAQALGNASRDVRAAAEERALLLAGISHDLRTPLTRLQFALEMVPDTDPELSRSMHSDIIEMDAILGQFIAFARDGRDEGSEVVDLAAICRHAVAAASKAWQVSLPDHALMSGKPMALLRAVQNLLANAERHGAPPFSLHLWAEGPLWVVEVADNGPGLADEAAMRALQPFVHDQRQGGTGLGLPIAERVARQHGGELKLLANTPQGLRAELTLRTG